jgi:hypothetical protein
VNRFVEVLTLANYDAFLNGVQEFSEVNTIETLLNASALQNVACDAENEFRVFHFVAP